MAKDRIDRAELADKLLEGVTSAEDPLRAIAEMIADFMMEAEVAARVGAEAHERSPERATGRNGFRDRRWDTRLGRLALKVPKLREVGYLLPSFIEHRKRSEQALVRRAGTRQPTQPGRGQRGEERRVCAAGREERQGEGR
jgi:transposase-like protein